MRRKKLRDVLWVFKRPFWRIKDAIRNYELRHLKLGKVKQHKKGSITDFEIVNMARL